MGLVHFCESLLRTAEQGFGVSKDGLLDQFLVKRAKLSSEVAISPSPESETLGALSHDLKCENGDPHLADFRQDFVHSFNFLLRFCRYVVEIN